MKPTSISVIELFQLHEKLASIEDKEGRDRFVLDVLMWAMNRGESYQDMVLMMSEICLAASEVEFGGSEWMQCISGMKAPSTPQPRSRSRPRSRSKSRHDPERDVSVLE